MESKVLVQLLISEWVDGDFYLNSSTADLSAVNQSSLERGGLMYGMWSSSPMIKILAVGSLKKITVLILQLDEINLFIQSFFRSKENFLHQ